jgi:hypothetical protein
MSSTLAEPEKQPAGETSPSGSPRSIWTRVVAFLERALICFCLYTLSIGPMYWQWLAGRQARGPVLITAFYEPLRLLGELIPAFGEWLNWYIRWWIL